MSVLLITFHVFYQLLQAIQRLEMLGHSIYKALEIHNETNLQGNVINA